MATGISENYVYKRSLFQDYGHIPTDCACPKWGA